MYNIKVEKEKVELTLQISNEEWEKEVDKVYQSNKDKYFVEGFRKGKVPRKVVEKNYGANVFFEDALNNIIDDTITDVMSKNPEYEPSTMPKVELLSSKPEEGMKVRVSFEIIPDFKMCQYTGLSIKVPGTKVSEEEVDHTIHHLLLDNSTFQDVDRPVQDKDSAVIDFVGFLDGKEFDGGSANDYPLEIGSHSFIDNFEEQLIGHSKGETVDVNVTFPENYHAEEFRNKKVLFKVTIKAVRERHLPLLDDKFISNATEFETVEEYRKDVFAHIQTMKQEEQRNTFNLGIRQYLVDHIDFKIPQEMIDRSTRNEISVMENYAKQLGMPFEEFILRMYGTDFANLEQKIVDSTIHRIKMRYAFRKIIKEQNLEPTDAEKAEITKGLTDQQEIDHKLAEDLGERVNKFLFEHNKMEIDESQKLEF